MGQIRPFDTTNFAIAMSGYDDLYANQGQFSTDFQSACYLNQSWWNVGFMAMESPDLK